jgi:hypothetical protein
MAEAAGMTWDYEHAYPGAPPPGGLIPLARPLYPPDAAEQGKKPSSPGPDCEAIKRGISRGGRWPWQPFDQAYSNGFAHGTSGNVGESGVAGFQRQQGIPDSGWWGAESHKAIQYALIPDGLPHAGEHLLDDHARQLLRQAWDQFGGEEPSGSTVEQVRDAIVDFCETGLAYPSGWNYALVRPLDVSVNPAGSVTSDCSMSAIQAFHSAGAPDPSKQGYSGYGNTTYFETEHSRVSGQYLVGDLAHYGSGGWSTHVTVCIRAGDSGSASWWSFGSEPPSRRSLYYRSDFLFVVRPPLT